MGHVIAHQQYTLLPMPCEVIDHVHCKAQQENASTGLSILNHWREEILDEPVHLNDDTDNVDNNNTNDDDSSHHPDDDADSLPITNELETESVTPIQTVPDEPGPVDVEMVNDNLQSKGVDHDNKTVIADPELTHTDEGDLFVPVELPANPVITPCLSRVMKKLKIDGVTPPILETYTQSGKVLSAVANLHVEQDGIQQC